MSEIAIKVENLSKKYNLGSSASNNLRESLTSQWNNLIGKREKTKIEKVFWALKDVSFEVKKGEVIGVIGRNGAGKSTLLKILSRITEPTTGRVELNGRVASLLEVGTGFHPELSGRENIFLNGSLLGMTRTEIKRKFDEIIDFSGVEQFIDTPVKKYSSGMYVRLAFAVAAHLEPEILLVDEILAVGDIAFQKKCLGKMDEVAKGGRTVVFVSHDMRTINSLCPKSILLQKGEIVEADCSAKVIDRYLGKISPASESNKLFSPISFIPLIANQYIKSAKVIFDQPVHSNLVVKNGMPFQFQINLEILKTIIGFRVELEICNLQGNILIKSLIDEKEGRGIKINSGNQIVNLSIPADLFVGGKSYFLRLRFSIYGEVSFLDEEGYIIPFTAEETGRFNRKQFNSYYKGLLTVDSIVWTTKSIL